MHEKTPGIAKAVRERLTVQQKLDVLRDAYQDEDCWILGTGPSILEPENLRESLRGKLVIAIKEAHDLLGGECDYHIVNPGRIKSYDYLDQKPITICISWPISGKEFAIPRWDLPLSIAHKRDMDQSVCVTRKFADWEFSKTRFRPWGPGIMHEVGMYLPVHFGCRRIFTIGFDMQPHVGKYFYDEKRFSMHWRLIRVCHEAIPAIRQWLKTHGIEWCRIASTVSSGLAAPTMNFREAIGETQ